MPTRRLTPSARASWCCAASSRCAARELAWYYQSGASELFPDKWERFLAPIPEAERGDLIAAYRKLLTQPDREARIEAARAWSRWEAETITLLPDPLIAAEMTDDDFAIAFARIENHYFVHRGWLEEGQLIRDAAKLKGIPGIIIQGRYDAACPPVTAWDLLTRLAGGRVPHGGRRRPCLFRARHPASPDVGHRPLRGRGAALMTKERLYLFDTTLRDGQQTPGVDFSVEDKILIARMLDELGVDYVEGGYPGANPTDTAFFARKRTSRAAFTAFGMVKRAGRSVDNDPGLQELLRAEADAICFVAKSWDFHVQLALGCTNEENLECISRSVEAAVAAGRETMLDCEHFFDGYKANPAYALACVEAALEAGARWACCATPMAARCPTRSRRS